MTDAPAAAAALTPAAQIAAALAAQTDAQKAIATAAVPLMQEAQVILAGDDLQAVVAALKPISDALPPGNSATLIRHLLNFVISAQGALVTDIAQLQLTLQS